MGPTTRSLRAVHDLLSYRGPTTPNRHLSRIPLDRLKRYAERQNLSADFKTMTAKELMDLVDANPPERERFSRNPISPLTITALRDVLERRPQSVSNELSDGYKL